MGNHLASADEKRSQMMIMSSDAEINDKTPAQVTAAGMTVSLFDFYGLKDPYTEKEDGPYQTCYEAACSHAV